MGGSSETSGIKQFSTIEEMQADTTATEGSLAIVYKDVMDSPNPGEALNTVTFPDEVVFTSPISTTVSMRMSASVDGYRTTIYFTLTSTRFTMSDDFGDIDTRRYDSTDGLTYTRTDTYEDTFDFGGNTVPTDADTNILKFLTIPSQAFEGLYKHNGTEYVLAKTQLKATSEDVMTNVFYGLNGVETGTLQNTENLNSEELKRRVDIWNTFNNLSTTETNLSYMFSKSTYTSIPLIDTSNVTEMNFMFSGNPNLVTIPLLNTSNVTSAYNMFDECSGLEELPLLDLSKLMYMNNMFDGCTKLKSLPSFDTSSALQMSNTFLNCSSLVEVPALNLSKVTAMNALFQGCTNLTTVPVFNISSVVWLYDMFTDCPNLSDESLNNIMMTCTTVTSYANTKTLKYMGLTSEQASRCTGLSNYAAFTSAGWTTGY